MKVMDHVLGFYFIRATKFKKKSGAIHLAQPGLLAGRQNPGNF